MTIRVTDILILTITLLLNHEESISNIDVIFGCLYPHQPLVAKKVAASKVKLIFSNESPYPIGKIKVTTLPPLNLGEEDIAKYGDLQILTIPIPPQCSDTVLLNSFNRLSNT